MSEPRREAGTEGQTSRKYPTALRAHLVHAALDDA
jgi:hypothetical protein